MTLDTVVMYDVNFIFQEIGVNRKKYWNYQVTSYGAILLHPICKIIMLT